MKNDTFNVYKYGSCVKIVYFKTGSKTPKKGFFEAQEYSNTDERLSQSVSRTKATILELALCNPFTHFCTFTQSEDLRDRFDLDAFRKDFAQFVRDLNKKRGENDKIQYLLVPEQHQDGAWHMHGLLMGLGKADLVKNEHGYLDWPAYRGRFGFFSVSGIRKKTACCRYITKYVTKAVCATALKSGRHTYFASQGLQRKQVVVENELGRLCPVKHWDFINDYVKVKWLYDDELTFFGK